MKEIDIQVVCDCKRLCELSYLFFIIIDGHIIVPSPIKAVSQIGISHTLNAEFAVKQAVLHDIEGPFAAIPADDFKLPETLPFCQQVFERNQLLHEVVDESIAGSINYFPGRIGKGEFP